MGGTTRDGWSLHPFAPPMSCHSFSTVHFLLHATCELERFASAHILSCRRGCVSCFRRHSSSHVPLRFININAQGRLPGSVKAYQAKALPDRHSRRYQPSDTEWNKTLSSVTFLDPVSALAVEEDRETTADPHRWFMILSYLRHRHLRAILSYLAPPYNHQSPNLTIYRAWPWLF